jgi:hypothetical protein
VTGDAGVGNSSGYKAVQIAADGAVYLAGWFQGTYQGLTSGAGYKSFVQRVNGDGSIGWTKSVSGSDSASPLELDLVIDGSGNPYVRICPFQCRFAAYDPATGNETAHFDSAGSNDASWPIGLSGGGVLIVDPQIGDPTPGSVRRLGTDLVEDWHYELTGEVDALGAVLVEALDGSIWVLGEHPSTPDHTVMVHLTSGGSKVGSAVEHAGFVPFSTPRAATPRGASPVFAVAEHHMWISVDKAGPAFGPVLSFATANGQLNGEVDILPPAEQVVTSAGLADCDGADLDSVFGTNGKPDRFNPEFVVNGTRLVTILRCTAHANGADVPVSMLAVYATSATLGGDYVRESVRFMSPSAKVEDIATNAAGALVLAGSTPGNVYLGPDAITEPVPAGSDRAAAAQNPTGNLLPSRDFTPLPPVRLFDTRPGESQGLIHVAQHKYGGAAELKVRVTGKGGVPTHGVGAVSLNVTVTGPAAAGFVTVDPCGPRPLVSSVNYRAGETVANAVVAPVSSDGEICLYASADTHLIADVNGWFRLGNGFSALPPGRLFDTRPSEPVGLIDVIKQRYGGANVLSVHVDGVGGIPASGVAALSLNVTVTDPSANGFVTVYPCGDRPLASNVNFLAGQTVPNAVIAPVSPSGDLCFYSSVDAHLLADVNGWFATGSGLHTLTPNRVFDTRATEPQGAVSVDKHKYGGGQELVIHITGAAGVPPSGVGAVSLNVTATQPVGNGYVTVYPCGMRPLASSINYSAGATVPNAVIAPVSPTGDVCFYSLVDTELLADVNGWFDA